MAKTAGLVILAAVLTALLTTWIQVAIWGKTNSGVSGGATTGVVVAIIMARRKQLAGQPDQQPKS